MSHLKESSGRMVIESASDNPDRVWIDLITPGWGSSGYYSKEVLERDMPKIYPKGSHMYIDHPTMTEMQERPERSVKELAAVLTETARWSSERGSVGAYAELFPDWAEPIKAKSKAIGVSIFADGTIEESATEIDGKSGPIIHELTEGFSVDFVTLPGRGGKIGESERPTLRLLESAREELRESGREGTKPSSGGRKETDVDELERVRSQLSEAESKVTTLEGEKESLTTKLTETERERDSEKERADRAEDAIQLAEASKIATEAVKAVEGLPERAQQRAVGAVLREALPTKEDGKLDKEVLKERAEKAAKEEVEYLTESGASGSGSGVTGLGSGITLGGEGGNGDGGGDATESKKSLKESLQRLGMSEEAAEIAAEGR